MQRGQEPVQLVLHLEKPDPSQSRLSVMIAYTPLKEYPPADICVWRERCDKLNYMLRQYLGA